MTNLAYNYARIIIETGECVGCMTYSYEINNPAYIPVPTYLDEYVGKFYNQEDGHWYADADFTILCPELDW